MERESGRRDRCRLWLTTMLLATACGGVSPGPGAPATGSAAPDHDARRWRSFSELSPVWATASTAEHLWVATPGGLLRYALEGGEPLRVAGSVGPGGERVVAVVAADDALWALAEGGLARYHDGAWSHEAGEAPDVGAVTSLALTDGVLWVGGTAGLVAYGSGRWVRHATDTHVTVLSPARGGGAWVGTAGDGLRRVDPSGHVAEHRPERGLPCDGPVLALEEDSRGLWALCGRGDGVVLARLEEEHWQALSAAVPGEAADLGACGDRVVLLTDRALYRVGERASGSPFEAGEVALAPVAEPRRARPRRHRSSPTPAAVAEDRPPGRAEGRPAPRPFVPVPPALDAARPPDPAALRPLLRRVDVSLRDGGRTVRCDERGIWIGTEGLGVIRAMGRGTERLYRTLDLVVTDRPFSVAADGQGRAWLLTRDLRAGVLDEGGFSTASVEPDATAGVELLAFAGRGLGAYALGRVRGSDSLRIYRLGDEGWSLLLSRQIVVAGVNDDEGVPPGRESRLVPTFFAVGPRGRFWVGLSVAEPGRADPVRRGVLVLDRRDEQVVHHSNEPSGPGALRIPDEVAAVGFARAGDAWLGGLSGAVLIRLEGRVERYGESNGLVGDIVNDIAVDGLDVPWVATTSGVGRFVQRSWRFFLDAMPRGFPVSRLALDSRGELWGAGPRGAVHFDGERWEVLTRADGLASSRVESVHVDGRDRVWFVTDGGLSILERTH